MTFKQNLLDLFELFLLPGLAIFLPWPFCFRIFRAIAGFDFIYRRETQQALRHATSFMHIEDTGAWVSVYRLTKLVDHADLYLSIFRSDRWLKKYISVTGHGWPMDNAPFLAVTFHFGAGMWSLRHLKVTGRHMSGLMKGFDRDEFSGRLVRYWYCRLRTFAISMAGVKKLIFLNNSSYFRLRNVFRPGSCLIALFDVPVGHQRNVLKTTLFGRDVRFPRGLIRLAAREKIPVIAYSVTLDRETGVRSINIAESITSDSEEVLGDYLVNEFKKTIYADTPSWHCWEYLDMFFANK
ncbi:MAG: hypothetical protein ACUVQ6_05965 [Dissulfurimicrobium sp.]|uniref:hypothetical protein n=1 Tax=Dissulfurimicrobium sp. TaxID=2022436 RepID=UPI00404A8E3C